MFPAPGDRFDWDDDGFLDGQAFFYQCGEAVPFDDFLSYQIRPSKRARNRGHDGDDDDDDDDDHGLRHATGRVSLKDRFAERTFRVVNPLALLNPAVAQQKGGEIGEPFDSETSLIGYKVLGPWHHRPRVKNIVVTNQFTEEFGELSVDLFIADRLLVPASKSFDQEPAAPVIHEINVDHFLCYTVKQSRDTPRFPRNIQVSVVDQFNDEPKLFGVTRPTQLCTPVDKDGEGVKNSENNLMCYSIRPARGQPGHERIEGLWVSDQFGSLQVDTRTEKELCVPSTIAVPPEVDQDDHKDDRQRDRDNDDDDE